MTQTWFDRILRCTLCTSRDTQTHLALLLTYSFQQSQLEMSFNFGANSLEASGSEAVWGTEGNAAAAFPPDFMMGGQASMVAVLHDTAARVIQEQWRASRGAYRVRVSVHITPISDV